MDAPRTSLCLVLLLLLHADADQDLPSEAPSLSSALEPNATATGFTNATEAGGGGPFCDCLIDTEMGLVAIGSAGGLIVCLLLSTVVLACQVHRAQRHVYAPRASRSNADLVGGASYWEAEPAEVQGLVGPYDASVMLEEVRAEQEGAGLQEGGGEAGEENFNPGEKAGPMSTSRSRDSCLEVLKDLEGLKDLEDTPLVV